MSVITDIVTMLENPVTGNTSIGLSTRIYPDVLPQDATYPAAVLELDSADYAVANDGDVGLDEYDLTLTIYSRTRSECQSIPDAIWESFHLFKGNEYTADSGTISLGNNYRLITMRLENSFYHDDTKVYQQEISLNAQVKRPSTPTTAILDNNNAAVTDTGGDYYINAITE